MKKLTILVDMDAIVADFIGQWFDIANERHELDLKVSDCTTWAVTDIPKFDTLPEAERKAAANIFMEPGFFAELPVIDGSQTALKMLQDEGHDVYFLTAPANAHSAQEKMVWVDKHFPFIGSKKTMICHNKTLVKGDVLIDDKPSTLIDYHKEWPGALLLTIAYPYNTDMDKLDYVGLAGHYSDCDAAWGNILNSIRLKASE